MQADAGDASEKEGWSSERPGEHQAVREALWIAESATRTGEAGPDALDGEAGPGIGGELVVLGPDAHGVSVPWGVARRVRPGGRLAQMSRLCGDGSPVRTEATWVISGDHLAGGSGTSRPVSIPVPMTSAVDDAALPVLRERRRKSLLALAGLGIVLVGATGALIHRWGSSQETDLGVRQRPEEVVGAFREPQGSRDRVPHGEQIRTAVRLESTRYVGTTAQGKHFIAKSLAGQDLCLVTVPSKGAPAETGCGPLWSKSNTLPVVAAPEDESWAVAVLRDGQAVPEGSWTRVSSNLAYRS